MRKVIFVLIGIVLLLGACGKKDGTGKNMQQLQNELGIPVRVETVALETFSQELTYNAPLGGMEESTAQAMVGDIVTAIQVKIGDRVSAGQLVMTFPRNTPAAQYEQATTAKNAAKTAYDRMQNLRAQGAISQQDLDNVETGYKVALANLEASEKMINVRAPISGVVTRIMVNTGEKAYPGQDLFTVSATNGFKAKLMVPDTEISKLKVGTSATATWQEQTLKGKISRIALAVDPTTKAIAVEVTFPGANRNVSFGVTAQIKLLISSKQNVIVVARESIVIESDSYFVWVNENNHAKKKQIQTGLDNSLQYEVTEGLSEGDSIIVEGISQLTENALLNIIQ